MNNKERTKREPSPKLGGVRAGQSGIREKSESGIREERRLRRRRRRRRRKLKRRGGRGRGRGRGRGTSFLNPLGYTSV